MAARKRYLVPTLERRDFLIKGFPFSCIGPALLWYRQKFGHGLRTAWFRDVIRQRILQTPPVENTLDKRCEVHVLTSARDWLNMVWSLKSFYVASGKQYALCIHDDGSLEPMQIGKMKEHFPQAGIILRAQADSDVLPALQPYPRCLEFRQTNHLSPKLFDFAHYLRNDRMLLLDSDVLFFREPAELLRRTEGRDLLKNAVNADVGSAYTITPKIAREQAKVNLIERFNSGLGVIHRDSLRLDWLEEFLGLPGLANGHFWRIEQTLLALCSSRFGVELLPREYDIRLNGGIAGAPSRHYVGAIRHLFYREGIRQLKHLANV